ncbi:hypothetical protein K491DRAFT_772478 [Lophiostoma macrostomum CBS 122681]|uniref:Uncharacterized protein n=1 Tax=Lophiostoma macrostomum CBS 122681 TaxID=1314788 RepID=A0A6A6SMT0_9PLEO|nr:hypothetical protein K491DRAFT_772478 [Lophiostoma macrostomum CBS 122681]
MSMTLNLSRKRSRITLESDDEVEERREQNAPLSPMDALKRTRTRGELDEVVVVPPDDAWAVDVEGILASPTLPCSTAAQMKPHNNVDRFENGESILVLCVQGNMHLHYDLLWAMLPDLYNLAPSLQALVLCRDPSTHVPSISVSETLPLVQAVGTNYNHFVKLGLLHPLGGGHFPLDALVVIDKRGRRRMVLPFGWGAGKHAGTSAGRGVQDALMRRLRDCIEILVQEDHTRT